MQKNKEFITKKRLKELIRSTKQMKDGEDNEDVLRLLNTYINCYKNLVEEIDDLKEKN